MTKLNSLAKFAIASVAGATAILSASSAQAVILFDGTLQDWEDAANNTISAGDKDFTLIGTDLDLDDILIIETAGVNDLDYLVNVDLAASDTTLSSFFLDYTVTVTDPDFVITAVDLDSTVDVFEPDEVLTTDFTGNGGSRQLISLGGSAQVDSIGASTTILVENDYTTPLGGEISAFENSFQQVESVPEPASILGLLAVSGLGLGLKRKKQS